MNEKTEPAEVEDEEGGEDSKRERSTIAFPYSDYESAAKVAAAIHGGVGHGTCSAGQLAAWMNLSSKSSGFRVLLSAARLFGLIESDSPEVIRLTELGRRALDPGQSSAAQAEAFLKVPLFRALYEEYRDGVTPPAAAIERQIRALGVSEKQKTRARQIFEASAQQTGFRSVAPNKLVMPAVQVRHHVKPDTGKTENESKGTGTGGGGGDGGLGLDPLLMALLRKIPKTGDQWPADARVRWFKTFAMNVSQVYDDDASPVEMSISAKNGQGAA